VKAKLCALCYLTIYPDSSKPSLGVVRVSNSKGILYNDYIRIQHPLILNPAHILIIN